MASAGWALQQAIFQALSADAALTALIGEPRIYDAVPRHAPFPYVTFGRSTLADWSTGSEGGNEHLVTLHVWSGAAGARETHEILDALRTALHGAPLALSGHRLVSLRCEFSEARREPDGETYHGLLRCRALTEPLP